MDSWLGQGQGRVQVRVRVLGPAPAVVESLAGVVFLENHLEAEEELLCGRQEAHQEGDADRVGFGDAQAHLLEGVVGL